jgi:Pyruvate/2-oxoacid:ferredoxin oxidoreductase delta subunit
MYAEEVITPARALLHVFSGTGNTAHLARLVAERLRGDGTEVRVHAVRRDAPLSPADSAADLHVVLFPVYACSVPHLMARHIRSLPPGHSAPAAVACTVGRYSATVRDGWEGGALAQARAMLSRRGYVVYLTDVVDYPSSITNVIPAPPLASQAVIMADAMRAAADVAERISRGQAGIRPCTARARAGSRLFGWLYSLAGRFMFGKLFVADRTCDGCGLCSRSCPARALVMVRGLPLWRWRCEGCERCMNLCPRHSIQLSPARLLLFSVPLAWNPLVPLALGLLPGHGTLVTVIVHLLAYIAGTLIMDLVASLLERLPLLGRLMALSWTRGFRRWLAPGFDPRQ